MIQPPHNSLERVLLTLLRVGIVLGVYKVFDDAWDMAALALGAPGSASHAVGAAPGYVREIGLAYLVTMGLMLPAMASYLVPHWPPARWPAKLAMLGIISAALLWIAQWYITRNTDLDVIRAVYLRRTVTSVATTLYLGAVLNALLPYRSGAR